MDKHPTRLKWFHEARFGMFVHYGLYSVLGTGEWSMYVSRIPLDEYSRLASKFNPRPGAVEGWVKLAKEAGAGYVVVTTRHHDGYCLFDSKHSDFTSVKTGPHRDIIGEYVTACRKHGMRVGLYYSLMDWRFPGYFLGKDKAPESFEAMVKQAHAQVRELLTNYGKVDVMWFDGAWMETPDRNNDIHKLWRSKELIAMMRKLQPDILINDRAYLPEDFDTPDQHVTAAKPGRSWEACMTVGDSVGWGYIKHNPNMKTVPQLIQHLVNAAAYGGNLLLNVGPKPDGLIQREYVDRLRGIGEWMKQYRGSICGSERIENGFGNGGLTWVPSGAGLAGQITAKGDRVYVHLFRWPGTELRLVGVKNKVRSVKLYGSSHDLPFEKNEGILRIKGLPARPPHKYDSVIEVKLSGRPQACSYKHMPLPGAGPSAPATE
jgi:alpha-L-fucosidase